MAGGTAAAPESWCTTLSALAGSDDLNYSPISPILLHLAAFRRIRSICMRIARRLEGGEFYSGTLRKIMDRYYDIQVGAYSYGECFAPGSFSPGVRIGRYVSIASGVRFGGRNHPINRLSTHPFFFNATLGVIEKDNIQYLPLEIGHDAWIGANTYITASCRRIGIGAIVGANSVVTKDIGDYSIVAGVPARLIRFRFSAETIAAILASRWWDLSVKECVRVLSAMTVPLDDDIEHHPLIRAYSGPPRPR